MPGVRVLLALLQVNHFQVFVVFRERVTQRVGTLIRTVRLHGVTSTSGDERPNHFSVLPSAYGGNPSLTACCSVAELSRSPVGNFRTCHRQCRAGYRAPATEADCRTARSDPT